MHPRRLQVQVPRLGLSSTELRGLGQQVGLEACRSRQMHSPHAHSLSPCTMQVLLG